MPDKRMPSNAGPTGAGSDAETRARIRISWLVMLFGLAAVTILGVVAIVFGTKQNDQVYGRTKDILSMLLPLVGAWVGTILAFYYGKENFNAGTASASTLISQLTPAQKLAATAVSGVMIPIATAKVFVLNKDEKDVSLKELLEGPLAGVNRLPILEPSGRVRYVLHRSMFDGFISKLAMANQTVAAVSLQQMLNDDAYKRIGLSFGTVRPDARLDAVKALMDGSPDCSDVFVTEDGTSGTKTVGWITNVILSDNSKV